MNNLLSRFSWTTKDTIYFAKRLAVCMHAGMPLVAALRLLSLQYGTRPKSTGHRLLNFLVNTVENGQNLSSGMKAFTNIFGEFAIAMVSVGELTGSLQKNFQFLAQEFRKKHQLRKKITGALIYPCIVGTASSAVVTILMSYVFPKILPIFKSLKFQLPWSTRLLIFLSNLFLHHTITICLITIIGIAVLYVFSQTKVGKRKIHILFLHLPIIGALLKDYYLANLCRTLRVLLASNTNITRALEITAATLQNNTYSDAVRRVSQEVGQGQRLSTSLTSSPFLFSSLLVHMVLVAETTGSLIESLDFLTEMYESEIDEKVKNLTDSLEPILMIAMGLTVGFIAIAIITPIYGITQALHP